VILGTLTANSVRETSLHRRVSAALTKGIETMGDAELATWRIDSSHGQILHLDITLQSTREISKAEAVRLQERVAAQVGRPVSLTLAVIATKRLAPVLPPANPP